MNRSRIATWALAGVLAVGTMSAVTDVAEAACTLGANKPYRVDSDTVAGKGIRGTTCTTSATVTTTVRKQRSMLPDTTVASNDSSGVNFTVTATTQYPTYGGTYRTRAVSSGGSFAESAWTSL